MTKKATAFMLLIFALGACGQKKDPNKTNTGIPGYDTTLPKNKILNRLKNTSWEIPAYRDAAITFKNEGTTVSMNKDFVLKDARTTVVSESNGMLVFIVDDLTNSVTFSLKIKDNDTITVAAHAAGANDDSGKMHDMLAQEFKKIKR